MIADAADVRERTRALVRALVTTHTPPRATAVSLIAVRAALAWIFIYHGGGTLFGWFSGPGLHRMAIFYSQTAHLHPGGFFAVLGGVTELGSGIALVFGVGCRLAGFALFGDMVLAMITVTWANGIVSGSAGSGYELNLALAPLCLVVAIFGGGRYSIDAVIYRRARPSQRIETLNAQP